MLLDEEGLEESTFLRSRVCGTGALCSADHRPFQTSGIK
jgi:hypothetical protein